MTGMRRRKLCPFLYEILSDSESEVTETSHGKIVLEPATGEVAAMDVVRRYGVVTRVEGHSLSVVRPGEEEGCFLADQPLDVISQESGDEPTSSGIVKPVDDVDNTLQAGEIPKC